MIKAYKVLLPIPVAELTYLSPVNGQVPVPGARIAVPWQNGVRIGFVTGPATEVGDRELRHAVAMVDTKAYVAPAFLHHLVAYASQLGVPAGSLLLTLAVPGLTDELRHEYQQGTGNWQPASNTSPDELETLRTNALITERVWIANRFTTELAATEQSGEPSGVRAETQRRALSVLRQGAAPSAAALARSADVPPSAVRALITKGYAEYRETYRGPAPLAAVERHQIPPEPATEEPATIVTGAVRAYRLAALWPAIRAALHTGSVLVLVPEQRFVENTAAWLAGQATQPVFALTDAASREAFFAAPATEPCVVVTTYSGLAITTPLALMVVCDYRHESYKLLSGARPWVDYVAEGYAAATGTEVRYTAQLPFGEIEAAFPNTRTDLPLPQLRVHAADMNISNLWPLHEQAHLVLSQTHKRGRQALVIAPRRGFSAAYACTECSWRAECPNCTLTLKYHDNARVLRCHQCGHYEPAPAHCPHCQQVSVKPELGAGIERFEQIVRRAWPQMRVYRRDPERTDDLSPLYAGAPGVVIATAQTGLRLEPLPNLALVVFTQFDMLRTVGDYRALDMALEMLYETAELRVPGAPRPLVVVQTYEPEQPALTVATHGEPATHLATLSAEQLARRKRFRFPPFAELTRVQFTGRYEADVQQAADEAVNHLLIAGMDEAELLGPAPAVVPRVRGQYVYQFLLRTDNAARTQQLLAELPKRYTGARMALDIGALHTGDLLF